MKRALLLAVHRVGGDERSRRRLDSVEQRLERRNLVALFGNRDLLQRQPQVVGDGRE
jgi:hypothetical protein